MGHLILRGCKAYSESSREDRTFCCDGEIVGRYLIIKLSIDEGYSTVKQKPAILAGFTRRRRTNAFIGVECLCFHLVFLLAG